MIHYETFMRIKSLHRLHGLSAAQIAGKLGFDGRTVEKWLEQDHYRRRKVVRKASMLDPYKEMIKGWLELYPYSANRSFSALPMRASPAGTSSSRTMCVWCARPGP